MRGSRLLRSMVSPNASLATPTSLVVCGTPVMEEAEPNLENTGLHKALRVSPPGKMRHSGWVIGRAGSAYRSCVSSDYGRISIRHPERGCAAPDLTTYHGLGPAVRSPSASPLHGLPERCVVDIPLLRAAASTLALDGP